MKKTKSEIEIEIDLGSVLISMREIFFFWQNSLINFMVELVGARIDFLRGNFLCLVLILKN